MMWSAGSYTGAQATPHARQEPRMATVASSSGVMRRVDESDDDIVCLFEGRIPVQVQEEGKDQALEDLVVCVMAGGTFPSSEQPAGSPIPSPLPQPHHQRDTSTMRRQVHFRITSPTNPYLLFTSTIYEEEFPQFRDRNQLRLDFTSLPGMLVDMLQQRSRGQDPATRPSSGRDTPPPQYGADGVVGRSCRLCLAAAASTSTLTPLQQAGYRFSFCQTDIYRDMEVLGLELVKEGDSGQKQYLASQLRRLAAQLGSTEGDLGAVRGELASKSASLEAAVASLRRERDALEAELAKSRSELLCEAERREKDLLEQHQDRLHRASSQAEQDLRELRGRCDAESSALQQRTQELAELKAELGASRRHAEDLEANLAQSVSEARRRDDAITRLEEERGSLEARVEKQHKEVQELTLSLVQSKAQGESLASTLEMERERGAASLQSVDARQKDASRAWEQVDVLRRQLEETNADFAKSKHIIEGMLAKQKDLKAKRDSLQREGSASADRVKTLEATVRSTEDDLRASRAEMETQSRRNTSLTEENEKLAKDLAEANNCIEYHSRYRGIGGVGGVGGSSMLRDTSAARVPFPTPLHKAGVGVAAGVGVGSGAARTTTHSLSPPQGGSVEAGSVGEGASPPPPAAAAASYSYAGASTPRDAVARRAEVGSGSGRGSSGGAVAGLRATRPHLAAGGVVGAGSSVPAYGSTILTASPSRVPSLVAKAAAATGSVPAGLSAGAPSNFFVSSIAGPVGSTA